MDPEFREAALRRGVKEKTLVILEENDIDNLEILRTQTTESLSHLRITAGQAGVLKMLMGDAQPETQHRTEYQVDVKHVQEAKTVTTARIEDTRPKFEDRQAVQKVRETMAGTSRNSQGAHGTAASSEVSSMKLAKTESKVNTAMLKQSSSAKSWLNRLISAMGMNVQAPLTESSEPTAGEQFTQELNEKGLMDIDKLLGEELDLNSKQIVHVGITGQSGQGKSSLINSLMNLECDDPNAAATDVVECTMDIFQYKHPTMENIIFHDLPGCNTDTFPQADYIDTVKLKEYHAVIICTSVRFTATDSWLAAYCRENNIPYYFVRTKLDNDIRDNEDQRSKKLSEQDLLTKIRTNIAESIRGEFPVDSIYLVCTRLSCQTKWDMPRLQEDIIGKINQTALILALTATSEKVINLKYDELKNRIPSVARRAVLATNPTEIVQDEVEIYRSKFGLSDDNFQKWGINAKKMSRRAQELNKKLIELDIGLKKEKKNLDSVADMAVEEETSRRSVGKWFLGVGYLVGWAMDSSATSAKIEQKEKLIADSKSRVRKTEEEIEKAAHDFLKETLEMYKDMTYEVLDARKNVYLNK